MKGVSYLMFNEAVLLIKTRKYVFQFSLFSAVFLILYFMIDYLNMSYTVMRDTYGLYLVIVNAFLNVIMALLSGFLMHLSTAMVQLRGKQGKGTSLGFFSVLFGILTYGCTPCVIAFFASIGIAFSVVALPLAGLPYKFISLLLISIGLIWIRHELNHGSCKVNLKNEDQ